MKKRIPLRPRQFVFALMILLLFTSSTLLFYHRYSDAGRFRRLTGELFQSEMLSSTLHMHYTLAHPADFGIRDYSPTLPCYSKSSRESGRSRALWLLESLKKLHPHHLTFEDAYTARILIRLLSNRLALEDYPYFEEPLSPHGGMQAQLPILLAEYSFRNLRDVEDYLTLLSQTGDYFASLLVYQQEKKEAGLFMSHSSLEKVLEQCATLLTAEQLKEGSHFLQTTFSERLQALAEEGILEEAQRASYEAANDRLLSTVLLPAYQQLQEGLRTLEEEPRPATGLSSHPGGREYYLELLRSRTGCYRDLQEIKELLLDDFKKEYDALRQLLSQYPTLSLPDSFPLPDIPAMLEDLQNRMTEDFPPLPQAAAGEPRVTVKALSPCLQEYCAPAFYLTAPLDDTKDNVIYINQKHSPRGLELYTTLAHEGYPGHLYQTVYCSRHLASSHINPIRGLLRYGGYVEGWALYVEALSYDYAAAISENPEIQLIKHNRYLQLCLYSLLDIMIHTENLPPARVSELLNSLGLTSGGQELYEYIVEEPCNYLQYYLGYLEILELQKEARALWQDAYSDLAFHRFFLENGPSDFTALHERLQVVPVP